MIRGVIFAKLRAESNFHSRSIGWFPDPQASSISRSTGITTFCFQIHRSNSRSTEIFRIKTCRIWTCDFKKRQICQSGRVILEGKKTRGYRAVPLKTRGSGGELGLPDPTYLGPQWYSPGIDRRVLNGIGEGVFSGYCTSTTIRVGIFIWWHIYVACR